MWGKGLNEPVAAACCGGGINMELRLWVAYALIGILAATAIFGGMYLRRASLKKENQGYNNKRSS